jgi:hypothetical protein
MKSIASKFLSSSVIFSMLLSVVGTVPLVFFSASPIAHAATATLSPSAVGPLNDWSGFPVNTNAGKVSAVATDDADTSYIHKDDNNKRQTFTFPGAGLPAGSVISSVKLYTVAKGTDAGSSDKKLVLIARNSAGTINSGSDIVTNVGYTLHTRTMTTNPFTSEAWTLAEVNSWTVTFGVARANSNGVVRVTHLYLEVDYTAPAPTGTLTLLKEVINDNGGTAPDTAWTLSASGLTPISGVEGDSEITDAEVEAGTYTLSESGGPGGYSSSGVWECEGGTQEDDDVVVIGVGEDVVCTITNDDLAPSLTLIKEVEGDADPEEWTLYADGPTPISGTSPVESDDDFSAGTYALSESDGPDDYTPSGWVCEGDGDQDGANITLGLGESATCTITNEYTPPIPGSITIVKNTVGGDATFEFDGDLGEFEITTSGGTGNETFTELTPGTYAVSEIVPSNWDLSSATCSDGSDPEAIDLDEEESVTCTFTNTKQVGTLIVVKNLVNDDEGTAVASDFSFQVNGDEPIAFDEDGENELEVPIGIYTVTEVEAEGYTTTYENCDEVEVGPGATVICTITNNDEEPEDPEPEICEDENALNFGEEGDCVYDNDNEPAVCSDGLDNDGDGLIDEEDPGCHENHDLSKPYNPNDKNEKNSSSLGISGGGYINPGGQVLGQVLGEQTDLCSWPVNTYMRRGYNNDSSHVRTLQQDLLNGFMQAGLIVDGLFGPKTEEAVKAFQLARKENVLTPWGLTVPTGIFYKTSLVEAKNIMCPDNPLPIPTDLTPWR